MMRISILILTLNEEKNLPRCLESLRWSDDIVVMDSFSTDQTLEIARAAGARVVQRKFDNERDQRTASLKLEFKHPWVYNPDADEVTPLELRDEMLRVVQDKSRSEVAYRVRFKTMFMGRWIKHSSLYPTWVVRLFRPEAISFERTINLRCVVNGLEGKLQSHFEHYTFNKGLDAWFDKHNRYSSQEAKENLRLIERGGFCFGNLWSVEPPKRRRALKELSFRLPFRMPLRFFYMYLVRLGFLDGLPGYHYCRLLTIYEYMIVLKMREIRRRQQGLPL
jgi:glycosyltransferase involved in cell wall biosynthesis